jgi:predicted nucleic acid-binding protein
MVMNVDDLERRCSRKIFRSDPLPTSPLAERSSGGDCTAAPWRTQNRRKWSATNGLEDTVQAFLQRVIDSTGDQEAALSPVGVVELVHGIHRGDTAERRARREAFVEEFLSRVVIYPLTTNVARLAGKLDAEQSRGVVIPFAALLIGGYRDLTIGRVRS